MYSSPLRRSREIRSFLSFVTFYKVADGGGRAETFKIMPDMISHSRDKYVLLDPGQSYNSTKTINIDKGYF